MNQPIIENPACSTRGGSCSTCPLSGFAGFLVLTLLAGGLGSYFTASSVGTWYGEIAKPSFTPPNGIFGPVWTTLFVMMAVAAWLVWKQGGLRRNALPLGLFVGQLFLNTTWSYLFFGLRSPGLALLEIVILWAAILATLIAFWRRAIWAGILMVPYLLWVSYATALNAAIWHLN